MRGLRAAAVALFALGSLGAGVRPPGLGDVRSVSVSEEPEVTRVTIELSVKPSFSTTRNEAVFSGRIATSTRCRFSSKRQ